MEDQIETMARMLRLPPLTEETSVQHVNCLDMSFPEYTQETVDCFFYCRKYMAPVLAAPASPAFIEGALSLYAAQVSGYLQMCQYAKLSASVVSLLLVTVNARCNDLIFSVMCSNFAEGRAATDSRLQNLGRNCLNSSKHGVQSHAYMITQSIVNTCGDIVSLLNLPNPELIPFFQNFVSIKCVQYALMLTDPNCIAHNMLTSDDQFAFYIGAAPKTKLKHKMHVTYVP